MAPKRHRAKGDSTIKTPAQAKPDSADPERERIRAERAAKARQQAFAVEAINARLRSRDVTEFVLPMLLATAGQTELTAAGKLLGVEPVRHDYTKYADYATPLREWADESGSNLARVMLAVAYCLAVEHRSNKTASALLTGWLDRLGYDADTTTATDG